VVSRVRGRSRTATIIDMMRHLGVIALAGLLLAACSSTSSGSGGTPSNSTGAPTNPGSNPDDPCSLLTHEQASEIIGEPAKPGRRNDTICMWDSTMGAGPYIKIELWPRASYDRQANRVPPSGVTQAKVDGIGDDAFAPDVGRAGHLLWFRKGDRCFKVDVFAARGPLKDLDAEKRVARYILDKL
jgi:hypothetical protein